MTQVARIEWGVLIDRWDGPYHGKDTRMYLWQDGYKRRRCASSFCPARALLVRDCGHDVRGWCADHIPRRWADKYADAIAAHDVGPDPIEEIRKLVAVHYHLDTDGCVCDPCDSSPCFRSDAAYFILPAVGPLGVEVQRILGRPARTERKP